MMHSVRRNNLRQIRAVNFSSILYNLLGSCSLLSTANQRVGLGNKTSHLLDALHHIGSSRESGSLNSPKYNNANLGRWWKEARRTHYSLPTPKQDVFTGSRRIRVLE